MTKTKKLKSIYNKLYKHFGPLGWWPGKSSFEVMIGAILTQNAAWSNVEKAIKNLKKEKSLSIKRIETIALKDLNLLIRPSGFYRQKAKRLKSLVRFLNKICDGKILKLRGFKLNFLRNEFLKINGIGEETADSILLYALDKPTFVVDTYTKRICFRHKLLKKDATYKETQDFFVQNLPKSVKLFNEYHALIVETGKNYCKKKKPLCKLCPLKDLKVGQLT